MERYSFDIDKESIITKERFIVDNITPVVIKQVENNFIILFKATEDSTEENKYIQLIVYPQTNEDISYLNNDPINIINIANSQERTKQYKEFTKDLDATKVYTTNFVMRENKDKKIYFSAAAYRKIDTKGHVELLELLVSRDIFVKINVYLSRLFSRVIMAETVFFDKVFKNVSFFKVEHVKLNASASELNDKVVRNSYTCGIGPKSYRFNFVSPKIPGLALKNPSPLALYTDLYGKDFVIDTLFFNEDLLYIPYVDTSPITGDYKSTVILIFTKEMYDKTNIIDNRKIYT